MSDENSGYGWGEPPRYEPPPPFAPPPYREQPYQQQSYGQWSAHPTAELPVLPPTEARTARATQPGGTSRRSLLMVAAVLAVAALGAAAFFVFHSTGSSSAAQRHTVLRFLAAASKGDASAASAELCAADRQAGVAERYIDLVAPQSYTVGSAVRDDAKHAHVAVQVQPSAGVLRRQSFPVVKETVWRVCLTDGRGLVPGLAPSAAAPTGQPLVPIPSIALPHISLPHISVPPVPNAGAFCASSTDAATTALTYIGAAEIGSVQLAQGCVYRNSVSRSLTASIASSGAFYAPVDVGSTGPVFRYATLDGTGRLAITVAKEPDGRFYVTRVVRS